MGLNSERAAPFSLVAARRLLVLLMLLASGSSFAQGSTPAQASSNPYLRAAEQLYSTLDFEKSLEQLDRARAYPGTSLAEVVEIEKLTGMVKFNLGDVDGAQASFRTALALDLHADLPPNESPKMRTTWAMVRLEIVRAAHAQAPAPPPPAVAATPPPSSGAPSETVSTTQVLDHADSGASSSDPADRLWGVGFVDATELTAKGGLLALRGELQPLPELQVRADVSYTGRQDLGVTPAIAWGPYRFLQLMRPEVSLGLPVIFASQARLGIEPAVGVTVAPMSWFEVGAQVPLLVLLVKQPEDRQLYLFGQLWLALRF